MQTKFSSEFNAPIFTSGAKEVDDARTVTAAKANAAQGSRNVVL